MLDRWRKATGRKLQTHIWDDGGWGYHMRGLYELLIFIVMGGGVLLGVWLGGQWFSDDRLACALGFGIAAAASMGLVMLDAWWWKK